MHGVTGVDTRDAAEELVGGLSGGWNGGALPLREDTEIETVGETEVTLTGEELGRTSGVEEPTARVLAGGR